MSESPRRDLVRKLTNEIKLELDDEPIRNLSDEALAELGEAYLKHIEAIEEETGKRLEELLKDEEFLAAWGLTEEYPVEAYGEAAADEIPDDDDDLIFEGQG